MKKFVIVSDSCCDLPLELRKKYDVDYIPMHFSCDGKDMVASLDWEEISLKDFYASMRSGKRFLTAQVTSAEYKERFTKYLENGYDILSISCSSALSSSVKASFVARDELLKKYTDSKIICIDSLNSCMGLGILCIRASQLREEGKTIEETANWIEENKLTANQECTVESLKYLKQAGRVSAATAFFGGLLSVKPIIISDVNGNNSAVEKVKGRANSIKRVAERVKESFVDCDYQNVYLVDADCEQDAEMLMQELKAQLPQIKEINRGYIGPIIGSSAGPGTVAVYFFGKEVEFNPNK